MARCNVISFDAHAMLVAGVLQHHVKHRTSSKAMKARCMNEMKYFFFLYVCRLSITMATITSFSVSQFRIGVCWCVSLFSLIFECVAKVFEGNINSHSISIEQRNIDTSTYAFRSRKISDTLMLRNFWKLLAVRSSSCWSLSFWVSVVSDEKTGFWKLAITKWNSFVQFLRLEEDIIKTFFKV